MKKILLIVEKSGNELWGRVKYEDNLLIDSARTLISLERKFRKLLKDFHGLEPDEVNFEYAYDMQAIFEKFEYLNITAIAERAKMNPALLRQYSSGVKHPSAAQAKKLETAIHAIGKELTKVMVYAE